MNSNDVNDRVFLRLIGFDSKRLPVYAALDRTLYKDMTPYQGAEPSLYTTVGNEVEGDPVTAFKGTPVFLPGRSVVMSGFTASTMLEGWREQEKEPE